MKLSCIIIIALHSSVIAQAAIFGPLYTPAQGRTRHMVTALSPDGQVAFGRCWTPGEPEAVFRWEAGRGTTQEEDLPGWGTGGWPTALSYHGEMVVGSSEHLGAGGGYAFGWTALQGRSPIVHYAEQEQTEARAVSWDGATIAGDRSTAGSPSEAVVWRNGSPVVVGPGHATAVSADGAIVAGVTYFAQWPLFRPFLWTEQAGLRSIDMPACDLNVAGLSADGGTLIGSFALDGIASQAFMWQEDVGVICLGDLPGGGAYGYATGVSADGSIVVGASETGRWEMAPGFDWPVMTAFIWDSEHGMRSLPSVLEAEHGIDLGGWQLLAATAISADGRTIVGDGISPEGEGAAWIFMVPEPGSLGLFLPVWALLLLGRRR